MKPFATLLVLFLLPVFTIAQGVSISDTGAVNPHASSVLDIVSIDKGVLLPRVTTAQRVAMTVTQGLLVFDTDSNAFYYVDDADDWRQISNSGKYDGSVRILNDSTIILNDGFYIDKEGSLLLASSAVAHDDLRVPASSVKIKGSQDIPEWGVLTGNLQTLFFDSSDDDQIFFVTQMPHSYKEGTEIHPHIHWMPTTGGTGNVVWGFEYAWFNVNDVMPSATSETITVAAEADKKQQIAAFTPIDGTGKKISSILICRVWRESSNGSDDYSGDAGFLEFDFHYEVDAFGSREWFVK